MNKKTIAFLESKALWVRNETLRIHQYAQETRIASSISPIELFVALYYGGILKYRPKNIKWEGRDRFIVSKGHGAIALYPILADLGFFSKSELKMVCKKGSFLGGIPDPTIPGFETANGSLGHGLGVGSGMALAIRQKNRDEKVFVLVGDGELYEGSNWEAIMFAGEHKLGNLIAIVDKNKISMLDYCKNIIDLNPLENKFKAFNWKVKIVDGHNIGQVFDCLVKFKKDRSSQPKVIIANTIKGKGISCLEGNSLCHIRNLNDQEINESIRENR